MWNCTALGVIKATQNRMDAKAGARPVRFAPRRAGRTAREAETEDVNRLLEADAIKPTSSEWGFTIVLVPRKDGTLRFCVDYWLLKVVNKKDSYPLPRMDERINSVSEATISSTLACNSGCRQVAIAPEGREKTAFVCHAGASKYKQMPFGLKNGPTKFHGALDIIFFGIKWQSCLIYRYDVIVYSKTGKEHICHVGRVLRMLRDARMTFRLFKCRFLRMTVENLGHVIKPGRLGVMGALTRSLREAHFPATRTQVRSFEGM